MVACREEVREKMLDKRYAAHLLEGRLEPAVFERQKLASTVGWDPAWRDSEAGRPGVEDVVFRRHDNTVRHVVPWIESCRPLRGAHLIDFGSGCGSSSLALSHFAGRVESFEIDPSAVAAARTRMELFHARNVELHLASPEEIVGKAAERIGPQTSVVLVAVVEHLLEAEQLQYLRMLWSRLAPGQVLVITETPNYYAWFDTHTFQLPFASMVPDPFFMEYVRRTPGLRFRSSLLDREVQAGAAGALELRRRFGMGVTHHVFEQAFQQDLNEVVVGDGFDEQMLGWFGVTLDDRLLLSAFEGYNVKIPVGFARSVLSFVFRKPRSSAEEAAARQWNEERRTQMIAIHGAMSELNAWKRRVGELEGEQGLPPTVSVTPEPPARRRSGPSRFFRQRSTR